MRKDPTVTMASPVKAWVEALRLRTLPVSTAGVLTAWALALHYARLRWLPALICLAFAVLCQISSNFANEYYDFRDGMDRPGRSGPRRGVTEGDINASAMKTATFVTLFFAMLLGLWLIYWSGPWLIIPGVVIALGAIAYSAGPYPLSRNGLGEVAVIFFFGLIPVNLTYFLVSGEWYWPVALYSLSIGLMGANVLIVNNYRDADEDKAVGKHTLANIFGRGAARCIYLVNGIVAVVLALIAGIGYNMMWLACVIYLPLHLIVWSRLHLKDGMNPSSLNPFLGITACLMLLFALLTFI